MHACTHTHTHTCTHTHTHKCIMYSCKILLVIHTHVRTRTHSHTHTHTHTHTHSERERERETGQEVLFSAAYLAAWLWCANRMKLKPAKIMQIKLLNRTRSTLDDTILTWYLSRHLFLGKCWQIRMSWRETSHQIQSQTKQKKAQRKAWKHLTKIST